MTLQDENGLQRLALLLRELGEIPGITPAQVEALKKAGFGLTLAFVAGLRNKIELLYGNAPLTEEEKQKLRALGMDPNGEDSGV
jgi:hypothetical protein